MLEIISAICLGVATLSIWYALVSRRGEASVTNVVKSILTASESGARIAPAPDARLHNFRSEAEREGLIVRGRENDEQRIFFFDLNSGQIEALAEPEKLKALMQLACRCSGAVDEGDCGAMLALVAHRDDIAKFERVDVGKGGRSLIWCRSYTASGRTGPDWITFRQWLTEKGLMPTV